MLPAAPKFGLIDPFTPMPDETRIYKQPAVWSHEAVEQGFGHIARVHGRLDRAVVQPIIVAALKDPDNYVRGHGHDAADDTANFLGWQYPPAHPA